MDDSTSSISFTSPFNDTSANDGDSNMSNYDQPVQQQTPSTSVQYDGHRDYEPGEISNMEPINIQSPHANPDETESPQSYAVSTSFYQTPGSATSSLQNTTTCADGNTNRTNGSSNSSASSSNPIAFDHCYGLPYQDHNYGSSTSQASGRNSNGNGNGTNGNGGTYGTPSGNQRHPSDSHRSSSSISSGSGGGPTPIGRQGSGSNGGLVRRLNFYPNGNNSKPPTLQQYGPTPTVSINSALDVRTLSTGSKSAGSGFSDDDVSGRSETYKVVPSVSSTLLYGNGISPSSTVTTFLTTNGPHGITVRTSNTGSVISRSRLRSVNLHPTSEKPGQFSHASPGIHPRLAPPNVARCGIATSLTTRMPATLPIGVYRSGGGRTLTTSNTVGMNFHIPMLPNSQKQFTSQQSRPAIVSSVGVTTQLSHQAPPTTFLSGQKQLPLKRPGRPRGARSNNQQRPQQEQSGHISMTVDNMSPPVKTPRRRKSLNQKQQMIPTYPSLSAPTSAFSNVGMEKSLSAGTSYSIDTVSSGVSTVPTFSRTVPLLSSPLQPLDVYQSTFGSEQQRHAHLMTVTEAIGGPLMVGTSPIIPAHPMFMNAAAGAGLGAGVVAIQQQQLMAAASLTQEKGLPSTSASNPSSILGQEEFQALYNDRMSHLFAQVGLDKDEEQKSTSISVSPSKSDRGVILSPKTKPHGRQMKFQGEMDVVKTEPLDVISKIEKANNVKNDAVGSASNENDSSDDEWRGKDYTTRCLCELGHNDEFMIQCDKCEVWQHCECMGLDTKNIPENYLCELCDPRTLKLTRDEAQRLQQSKMAQWKKKKDAARRRRQLSNSKRASIGSSTTAGGRGRPRKSTESSSHSRVSRKRTISSSDETNPNKKSKSSTSPVVGGENFMEATRNICTAKVARAIRATGDTVGASALLAQLPSEAHCKSMFVAPGRQGLVATDTIYPDLPIIEYRGKICWYADADNIDGRGNRVQVGTPYILYYRSGGTDGSEALNIYVDSRYTGTSARFVRRSCQPNAQVKHVVYNGSIHVMLVSTELIECSAEITIPFDYDIAKCSHLLECACENSPLLTPNPECPVATHNKTLLAVGSFSNQGVKTEIDQSQSNMHPKRRPGRPPGSGKQRSSNAGKSSSATAVAARKKAKKARGFKVRIVGKKGFTNLGDNHVGSGNIKGAKVKLQFRSQERIMRRHKPTATADLTKRRFSEDTKIEENIENRGNEISNATAKNAIGPGLTRRYSGTKAGKSNVWSPTAAVNINDQQSPQQQQLTREERKIQTLMEQISRMEQREQKKAEKRLAKSQSVSGGVGPARKSKGRTPSGKKVKISPAGIRHAVSAEKSSMPRRKRAESEAMFEYNASKRTRLWSHNGEKLSSDSSFESSTQEMESFSKRMDQQSPPAYAKGKTEGLSDLIRATTALLGKKHQGPLAGHEASVSPPESQHKSTASDVAKKRWLRQAMSETTGQNKADISCSLSTVNPIQVDIGNIGHHIPSMQISPSTSAPPKKRIIQEFNSSTIPFGDNAASVSKSAIQHMDDGNNMEGPISTVEAAQLLAELHHQQPVVSQHSDGMHERISTIQQASGDMLKVIHPEEQPGPMVRCGIITETAAVFGQQPGFTPAPSDVSALMQSAEVLEFVPGTHEPTTSSYLYSAIEDNVPTVPFGLRVDESSMPSAQQIQKKKMSIEEYKKRKRESVHELGGPPAPSIPDGTEGSPKANFTTTTPPIVGTNVQQRQLSFIPRIKEGDAEIRNLRLGSVPDPHTIGKGSATYEELRQRIYRPVNRKTAAPIDSQQHGQCSGDILTTSDVTAAPTGRDPRSGANADVPTASVTPPPQNHATAEAMDSPEAARLPLLDRLRVEFGLD